MVVAPPLCGPQHEELVATQQATTLTPNDLLSRVLVKGKVKQLKEMDERRRTSRLSRHLSRAVTAKRKLFTASVAHSSSRTTTALAYALGRTSSCLAYPMGRSTSFERSPCRRSSVTIADEMVESC
jgi:hypothetical protein